MSFGRGLAGFADGMNTGLSTGQKLYQLVQDDQIAKVRAQGIAEAQAAQAAAAPQVQDLGDQQNLTANPQMSVDPNAAQPVNTSLNQFVDNAQAQTDGGPQSQPVTPQAPVQDTGTLTSQPMASAAPSAPDAPAPAPDDTPAPFANGLPNVPRKRFNVDGKGFDTAEDAAAYVKKSTPPLASYFKDTLIPKMTDALTAQGKLDQAAAWQKYADDTTTHEHMKTWSKAVQLEQLGDHVGAAEQLMKLHPNFDDGLDLVSAVPTKGPDGDDGFTMTVRDKDGNEQKVFHDAESITRVGLAQLSPIEMFNQQYKNQINSEVMQAQASVGEERDKRTAARQLANAKERDAAYLQRAQITTKAAGDRQDKTIAANTDRDAARAGYKSQQIDQTYKLKLQQDAQKIAQQGQFKKAVSPEERQAIVVTHLSSDPMFNMLSSADKAKRVAETMALIPQGQGNKPAVTVTNPGLDPKQQGIQTSPSAPAASPAPAGKVGVPIWDPTTNSMRTIYR